MPMTLEQIRAEFPFITGNLRADNSILEGVDFSKLHRYIKENQAKLQGMSMYSVVGKYRESETPVQHP